jgi:hypothetical protein
MCSLVALAVAACGPAGGSGLTEQQALDAAWTALDPNTSSHDRAVWEVISVEQVNGRDVADEFEGRPAPGCPGPEPPANGQIDSGATYWHVVMQPLPATSLPVPTEFYSPTAPPYVPEAFTKQAQFLIDASTGDIVARRLGCVIY